MSKKNQSIWEDTFRHSANYIRGLRNPDGTSVLKGPRRAAFIGWLVKIDSSTRMFHDLVSIGQVTYIWTYKLIQGKCLIFSIIFFYLLKIKVQITFELTSVHPDPGKYINISQKSNFTLKKNKKIQNYIEYIFLKTPWRPFLAV